MIGFRFEFGFVLICVLAVLTLCGFWLDFAFYCAVVLFAFVGFVYLFTEVCVSCLMI